MPTLVTEQGIVHYETLGRGRPVLLLHGWLGSWALWRNTIEVLSKEYKVYALDFFGFGESFDRGSNFSVENFVASVDQFMERLGIPKAALMGHSMGGTVSLWSSIRYPEKIVKTIVIGSPIDGSSLNIFLKFSGYRGIASIIWTTPALLHLFIRGYAYFLAKDGRALGNMLTTDLSKVSAESFFQSIGTLRDTDIRPLVGDLQMPILGVYGKRDRIVNPNQGHVLKQYAPASHISWFDKAGHFIMLDAQDEFHDVIRDFLQNG